jgi:hypothetical protein
MQFEINGIQYTVGALAARKSFHIARRMGPFLSALLPVIVSAAKDKKNADIDTVLSSLPEFLKVFASMSDEEVDYCVYGLLSCVTRKQDKGLGFAKVCNEETMTLMFSDITVPQMMQMAYKSFSVHIAPFFDDLLSGLSQSSQEQSAP